MGGIELLHTLKKVVIFLIIILFFFFLGLWFETLLNLLMGIFFLYSAIFKCAKKSWPQYLMLLGMVVLNLGMLYVGIQFALEYNNIAILKTKGVFMYLSMSIAGLFSFKGMLYGIFTSVSIAIQYVIVEQWRKEQLSE